MLYYPVGGLHGKLTVTPKLAPARPCGVRRHDAALELGDTSPSGSRPPARPGWGRPRPRVPKYWAGTRPPRPSHNPGNQTNGPILFTTVTAMNGVVIFKLPLQVVVTAVNRIALQTKSNHHHLSRHSRCSRLPPLDLRNPEFVPESAQIKAKTPAIVPNQGISRQTPFFRNALHTANPPAGWGGPAVERTKHVPEKIPLLGGDTGEGERHHQSAPLR